MGGVVLSRKPAISLMKGGKIGPRLLLMTYRKSHTRFRLVPKSTTLDDLELGGTSAEGEVDATFVQFGSRGKELHPQERKNSPDIWVMFLSY